MRWRWRPPWRSAQNLVCEREEDAKRGIAYLKETKGGRATFLPLTAVRGSVLSEVPENDPGFVGLACDLVQYDKKYEGIAAAWWGVRWWRRIWITPSLWRGATAINSALSRWTAR